MARTVSGQCRNDGYRLTALRRRESNESVSTDGLTLGLCFGKSSPLEQSQVDRNEGKHVGSVAVGSLIVSDNGHHRNTKRRQTNHRHHQFSGNKKSKVKKKWQRDYKWPGVSVKRHKRKHVQVFFLRST